MVFKYLFGPREDEFISKKGAGWEVHKHFEIKGTLGTGKYSTVYLVVRHCDGQLYSLKHTDITALNARARRAVVNEIRLLACLEHPNLLQYHEAFCDHHHLYIVTELAEQGDLGSFIDKRAEAGELLLERQVWSYFIQITLGLRYLHHNHVLHRDVKPQNILISGSGLLKIGDLGISQVLDTVFTRALVGTPYYMSPEMWRRKPYSFSADVWALGCILHELCTLQPLFAAASHDKVKLKVLGGMLGPLPARYSLDLWDVMRLLLTPDPAARPTCDEILQMPAVQAHMGDLPQALAPYLDLHDVQRPPLRAVLVPCVTADWDSLNALLPPARYPSGPTVVDALRMRHSRSCPDLAERGGGSHKGVTARAPSIPLPLPAAASSATATPAGEGPGSGRGRPGMLRRNSTAGAEPSLQRAPSTTLLQGLRPFHTLVVADLEAWRGEMQLQQARTDGSRGSGGKSGRSLECPMVELAATGPAPAAGAAPSSTGGAVHGDPGAEQHTVIATPVACSSGGGSKAQPAAARGGRQGGGQQGRRNLLSCLCSMVA